MTPEDKPNVALHPPSTMLSAFVFGFTLRVFMPIDLPGAAVFYEAIGGLLTLAALAMMMAAISAFSEAGETLRPSTPSFQLLSGGVYRLSRNPIYLAMVVFGIGFGIATQNLWIIATSLLAGVAFNFFVIPEEEAYLRRQFGLDYVEYCEKTRRWL